MCWTIHISLRSYPKNDLIYLHTILPNLSTFSVILKDKKVVFPTDKVTLVYTTWKIEIFIEYNNITFSGLKHYYRHIFNQNIIIIWFLFTGGMYGCASCIFASVSVFSQICLDANHIFFWRIPYFHADNSSCVSPVVCMHSGNEQAWF